MVKVRHGPAAVTLFVPFQFKGKSFSKQKPLFLNLWNGKVRKRQGKSEDLSESFVHKAQRYMSPVDREAVTIRGKSGHPRINLLVRGFFLP